MSPVLKHRGRPPKAVKTVVKEYLLASKAGLCPTHQCRMTARYTYVTGKKAKKKVVCLDCEAAKQRRK